VKIKTLFSGLIVLILAGAVSFAIAQNNDVLNCDRPTFANARNCKRLEKQILDSTVRIKVDSWVVRPDESGYDINYSIGHGTVMEGRYLVTHNHFNLPLNIRVGEGDQGAYGVVYLYSSGGDLVYKGPLSDYELMVVGEETLVFAHREEGFFHRLGFISAAFETGASLPLEPGMEVAQIDWDGATTRVDWVKVQMVNMSDGVPALVLDDGAIPGASGGGIFRNGYHVANNWRVEEKLDSAGEVIAAATTVALNMSPVVP
jgi:hypothetical protein